MGANSSERIVKLLFDTITEEGVSAHQIVCRTGLDNRTVKKYADLIIDIQNSPKIVKPQLGLRIVFQKSR